MKQLLHETYYAAIDTRASCVGQTGHSIELPDMRIVSLSGVVIDERRHWSLAHSDQVPEACVVSDIVDSSGEWSCVASNRNGDRSSFLILSDYAGYAPVFYSLVPGTALVVSDSFSGAVQGLSALGASITLNFGNYLTLIAGRSATFENLVSRETMADEIAILGPHEALLVDNDQVTIIARDQLSRASQINSYDQAVSAAVEHASRTISHFVSVNKELLPLLTLTGGVDSRLVFALLKTTSYMRDFRIWTMDPRNAKSAYQRKVHTADVEISNQIRKAHKLDWMQPRQRERFSVSFEESVARYQSFNSNFSFKFSPSTHLSLEKAPILTLRGGGGELLRGTGGARLAGERYGQYRRKGGKLEQVRWAADDYLDGSFLTDDLRAVAQRFLVRQLNTYGGGMLREKLDSFYRQTRNRAHFGHYRISETTNDYLLQVLSSPYFQRLADLAGYEYVSSNGLVRDIFKATDPKLRAFPFENVSAHEQLHLQSRKPFRYKGRDSWREDFDKVASVGGSMPFHFMGNPDERGQVSKDEVRKLGLRFIQGNFGIIETLVPPTLSKQLRAQHSSILANVRKGRLPIGPVIAKVASAVDIVSPLPLNYAHHFFTNHDSDSHIRARNPLSDAAVPYLHH